MCIMIGAALASSLSAASAVAGIAGTAVGIMQQQQQANYQAAMQRQQMDLQYRNAQRQSYFERQKQISKYVSDTQAQHAATLSYYNQIHNNNEAANRVYVSEQVKLDEARTKAAFKSQEIYAKQIGSMGKVLASGATGQSVGLLAMDAERQAGFGLAEQDAGVRSAALNAAAQMDVAKNKNESDNNLAASRLPAPVAHPTLSPDPVGIGQNLGLGIPAYGWT